MSDLSESIKYYRRLNDLTQAELAEHLNVKPTAVSAWELGRNKPLMDKIEMMSQLFNISKSELLGEAQGDHNVFSIFNQLNAPRQQNVYRYVKEQLEEQNNAEQHKKGDQKL